VCEAFGRHASCWSTRGRQKAEPGFEDVGLHPPDPSPIMHGLCVLAIAADSVSRTVGRQRRLREVRVSFAKPALAGVDLTVSTFATDDPTVHRLAVAQAGRMVVKRGVVRFETGSP
jgi:acyl dehydratase